MYRTSDNIDTHTAVENLVSQTSRMSGRLAAVEAGGTTFRCAVFDAQRPTVILAMTVIPTTDPETTLAATIEFLKQHAPFDAIGVATFGPVDLSTGTITTTPKLAWQNFPLVPRLKDAFPGVPCCFDTDVNAPAVAEAHEDPSILSCCYVTVGTGIGIGVCIGGRPVHGLVHPEGGHMYTPIVESDLKSQFTGVCPFHGCCLEGMASAPSLAARAQKSIHDMKDVADDDPLWDTAAHYYAHACVSMTLMLSPEKIVLGGGVFNRSVLYQKVRAKTQQLLNGYIQHRRLLTEEINSYIVEPKYGPDAGIQGARFLAQQALLQSSPVQ